MKQSIHVLKYSQWGNSLIFSSQGPSFLPDQEKVIPIVPNTVEFFSYNKSFSRTIVPLSPCYGITCHKCQGATCTCNVIIDLGDKEFSVGLFYTAFSRVKELNKMAFSPMPTWARVHSYMLKDSFKERIKEEQRLEMLFQETLAKYRNDNEELNEFSWLNYLVSRMKAHHYQCNKNDS